MNDYKRLVSYIYSYPGGVRDKNVGFAKAEVRNGQFKLSVSLKGVYTDTPETFGVYLMVDKDEKQEGRFTLLKLGNVIVNAGVGTYSDIVNPENINSTLYTFEDISGIAVANKNNRFYMMFSMWDDCNVNPEAVNFAPDGTRKQSRLQTQPDRESGPTPAETAPEETAPVELVQEKDIPAQTMPVETVPVEAVPVETARIENAQEEAAPVEHASADDRDVQEEQPVLEYRKETGYSFAGAMEEDSNKHSSEETIRAQIQAASLDAVRVRDGFEAIFKNADFIDAFDDDYYYNCVEVTPEQLKMLPVEDEAIINNSYLVHGYYNFKHILFGKVRENDNNTRYFIGVPGMYCNRERFMASMFGFRNFKKSHRSDYSNPYFGYWYQEI